MIWTQTDLEHEWKVCYETRLGIMCGIGQPTPEQDKCARDEADALVRRLKEGDQQTFL